MDDKGFLSKERTSVVCNPSAIARRKRMEILRFRKLSYSADHPNTAHISLHLKRARPPALDQLCDAWEDFEDTATPSPKLQKEEGSDCVQTTGKEIAAFTELSYCLSSKRLDDCTTYLSSLDAAATALVPVQTTGKEIAAFTELSCRSSPKRLEDRTADLFPLDAATTALVPVDMVKAVEQVPSKSQDSELQNSFHPTKKDVSLHQAVPGDASLHCHKEVDFSVTLEVASSSVQSMACTSCCSEGCPPSGMLLLCGRRREMEDRAAIVPCFTHQTCDLTGSCSCEGKEGGNSINCLHFFAVYDGYGGSQASQFCMERLHLVLAEELATLSVVRDANQEFLRCHWKSVMASCFSRMDKEMGSFCYNGDCHDVGSAAADTGGSMAPECIRTTAVVAVVSSWQIVIACCRNSRAVLSCSGKAVLLSLAHKPEREDTTNRCEAVGGKVDFPYGHGGGGLLALSRAMDVGYHHVTHFAVFEPEVMCIQRSEEDECLILASDGLWDVIDDEAACEIARKSLASTRSTREFGVHAAGEDPPSIAAAAILVKVAFGRGSQKNISVVVIDLKK